MAEQASSEPEPKVIAIRRGSAKVTESSRVKVRLVEKPLVVPIRREIRVEENEVSTPPGTSADRSPPDQRSRVIPLNRTGELPVPEGSSREKTRPLSSGARTKVQPLSRTSDALGQESARPDIAQGKGGYHYRGIKKRFQSTFTVRGQTQGLVKKALGPVIAKLNEEINQGNDTAVFTFVLVVALFKDVALDLILELTGIGEVPIIGWLPGMFLSGFLMYFLWGKGWFRKTRGKGYRVALLIIVWVVGGNVSIIKAIPVDTFTVLAAWRTVKKRKRKAEAQLEKIKRMNEREAAQLQRRVGNDPEYYEEFLDAA